MPPHHPEPPAGGGPTDRRPGRQRAVLVALVVALLWTGHGLVRETADEREAIAVRTSGGDPAAGVIWGWQLADPGPRRLAGFLEVMEHYLPPGARVAIVAPGKPASEVHFLELWAGYLLPRHRVLLRAGGTEDLGDADYLLSWELPSADPRLLEILRHPDGGLYRVKR